MANVYAVAAGLWSNTATWNTGALPTSSDDVYSNGFAVTIDQDVTVLSIRNQSASGISAGGSFTLQNNKTVNANIHAGTTQCVVFTAGGTSTINGNISGGTTTSAYGVNTNSSFLNINGNLTGGSGTTTPAVIIGANGNVSITGDVTGGSTTSAAGAYINSISASVIITGNVYGGTVFSGVYLPYAGTLVVNGDVTGGATSGSYGVYSNANGANVTINGNVTAGSSGTSYGVYNALAGTVIINGYATGTVTQAAVNGGLGTLRVTVARGSMTSGLGQGLYGINASGITTYERGECGSTGAPPVVGFVTMRFTASSTITVRMEDNTFKTLVVTDQVANGQPAVEDVRSGVVFDFGNKTGTCAVPLSSQVVDGIPIDNTVGTALLTATGVKAAVLDADVSTLTASNSIGDRLKNCSTIETIGTQIVSLNP